jgi:FkbH-like protein
MTEATEKPDRRQAIRQSFQAGELHAATQTARQLLLEQPGLPNYRFLRQLIDTAVADATGLKTIKVALLASFSIEFIHDALIAFGFANGLRVEIYQTGFGQIRQEVLNPASGLYSFGADVAILAVGGEDWLPEVYTDFMDADDQGAGLAGAVDRLGQDIAGLLQAYRAASACPVLLHNLAAPRLRRAGIADLRLLNGQANLVAQANALLVKVAAEVVDCYIVDYAALVTRFGANNWYDARMRLYAKAPIASGMLGFLAQEYMRYCRAFRGLTKKCLVVDLDNTLWGGVVGEDGVDGIALGPNYPGNAFVEFQRAVLDLHRRGVILGIASKNNPADVDEVFATHRAMLLRKEHFAATEIHWELKSESLRRIAQRLNIGLEHIVFADDNPAECALVRRELPMVTVIELPRRPEMYVEAWCAEGLFDQPSLSDEDRRRGQLYQQRAQAESMRAAASGNIEDYYRDLDMELRIAPVDASSIPRAAQLTQKTNQYNLTTTRYSEAEMAARLSDPDWIVSVIGVSDRFGDHGIVGVVMARVAGPELQIDNFLLSCRVIGRTVETAMLAYLCDAALQRGLHDLQGRIVPTAKNVPIRELFAQHGFDQRAQEETGSTSWAMALQEQRVAWPPWFRVSGREPAVATPMDSGVK